MSATTAFFLGLMSGCAVGAFVTAFFAAPQDPFDVDGYIQERSD